MRIEGGFLQSRYVAGLVLFLVLVVGTLAGCASQSAESNQENPDLDASILDQKTIVEGDPEVYSYQMFQKDAALLQEKYPDLISVKSIGTTADGRDLTLFVIGSEDAPVKLFFNAGIHAREYIVSQLLMKQTVVLLDELSVASDQPKSSAAKALENCALYILPMANPDGACIAQEGLGGLKNGELRDQMLEKAKAAGDEVSDYYCSQWKNNARCVDLNRNFDVAWDGVVKNTTAPLFDKGTEPLCEVESAAIAKLTQDEMFACTVSYHTRNEEVYWSQTGIEDLDAKSKGLAQLICDATGYGMDPNPSEIDAGVYKDWATTELGIPSVTVECGLGTHPVDPEQFPTIYDQNKDVLLKVVQYAKYLKEQ